MIHEMGGSTGTPLKFYYDENIEVSRKASIYRWRKYADYNIVNCLVLPTTHEGFGQVLIESLGCGTPVIGFDTDTNVISEIIDNEIFGLKTSEISLSGLKKVLYDFHDKKDFFEERRLKQNLIGKT